MESAGTRGVERILIALVAPNSLSSLFAHARERNYAALPTERIVFVDQTCSFPAFGADHAVVPRFNAGAADCAGLRIDERERDVVEGA